MISGFLKSIFLWTVFSKRNFYPNKLTICLLIDFPITLLLKSISKNDPKRHSVLYSGP